MNNKLSVFEQNGDLVGILEYKKNRKLFVFQYDEEFCGYEFGEINIQEGQKVFESSSMFSLFLIDESYGRSLLAEKHDISDPDSNDTQWYILSNFITKENPNKGFYFEKTDN